MEHKLASPVSDPLYTQVSSGGEYCDPDLKHPDSPQSGMTASGFYTGESEALAEGYTMDAFFISDGRSRRKGDGESHASPSRPYPPGIHPGGKILKFLMPAFPVLCILYTQTLYLYIFLPYFHLK